MTDVISSAQNPKVKLAKSLLLKKNRVKNGLYTVEGLKSVTDAAAAGADIKMIFLSEQSSSLQDDF